MTQIYQPIASPSSQFSFQFQTTTTTVITITWGLKNINEQRSKQNAAEQEKKNIIGILIIVIAQNVFQYTL